MILRHGTAVADAGLIPTDWKETPVTRSDSPKPGEDHEKDRDQQSQTPTQSPAEPIPEEELEQVEEQPS